MSDIKQEETVQCPECGGGGYISLGGCSDPGCCDPNPECLDCDGKGSIKKEYQNG